MFFQVLIALRLKMSELTVDSSTRSRLLLLSVSKSSISVCMRFLGRWEPVASSSRTSGGVGEHSAFDVDEVLTFSIFPR